MGDCIMAGIKINGDTSGSTTITAPNTGTDETIELSTALAQKLPYSYGTATPSTSVDGFLWYDENDTPPTPKFWDGSSFIALSNNPYLAYSETTAGVSTTSTAFQDVGATITFTAPTSGKVLASVEAIFQVTGGNQDGIWAFRDNSTSATIGTQQIFHGNSAGYTRRRMGYQVTGLTAGTSYTYKLSIRTGNASYTVSVPSLAGAKVQLYVEALA